MIRAACVGVGGFLMAAWFVSAPLDDAPDAMVALQTIRAESIRGGMRFLADDLLEGRGTATRGHELAARWMASAFEQLGLDAREQRVPLRASRVVPEESSVSLIAAAGAAAGAAEEKLDRNEFYALADPTRTETSVEAPVVFVRYGITAPEQGYDDFTGIDARGKIVAEWAGAPNFASTLKAHYSSSAVKAAIAVAHGAVGVITLGTRELEQRFPFDKQIRAQTFRRFNWIDRDGAPHEVFPELKARVSISQAAGERLFGVSASAGAGAGAGGTTPKPMTARIRVKTTLEDVDSPNIIGTLEGSDPVLKQEYVVVSAHLDHLGIGDPVNGDKIYNGAIDNASGSAILVEVARAFSALKTRPKRSILFVSVTGEESGLIGSDYFAHHPTVSKPAIVADINIDGDLMFWPLRDIIAFGAEHSTLDAIVRKAAARLQLSISPDPVPEQVSFIRSDQYSFVKQGIPAVYPMPGPKSDDPAIKPLAIFAAWQATHYHQPHDDMSQPGLDVAQAAKYAQFLFLCGDLVADDPARPAWNAGDFFGETYGAR